MSQTTNHVFTHKTLTQRKVETTLIPRGTKCSMETERVVGAWGSSGGRRMTTITYEDGFTETIFHQEGAFPVEAFCSLS